MINRKDVVRMKVPFPDISSKLAVNSHMYICRHVSGTTVRFVKCQTVKPYMLLSDVMQHYWDEDSDITRNPFAHKTRIDCDKEFVTSAVQYDDRIKTTVRPDVCDDTMLHIDTELACDGYRSIPLNEDDLAHLNIFISKI